MTDTDRASLGGYGPAIRTFWVKGVDLTVSRLWEGSPLIGTDAVDKFSTSIRGRAISEDGVCDINQGDQSKEFDLTFRVDTYAKQEWERTRINEAVLVKNDGTTAALRLRGLSFERFDKNPPTASLNVYRPDREIGGEGGWWIECRIPPAVLAQLEADLLAHRARELRVGIEWEVGLVLDEHAPPSVPTLWGLYTINETKGPETLRGYTKSVQWRGSGKPTSLAETAQGKQQAPPEPIDDEIDRLGKTSASQMLALTRACRIGFLAALALILLGHILR